MYKVIDATGHTLRTFMTYRQAYTWLIVMNRYDWEIR
jgi:hypothetical protein